MHPIVVMAVMTNSYLMQINGSNYIEAHIVLQEGVLRGVRLRPGAS